MITLESIKQKQKELDEIIAKFEAQSTTAYLFPETEIKLKPGEHYAGIIIGKDGEPSYHLILLPGAEEKLTCGKAKTWAEENGGELPTRREQALLYANLKDQFEETWYWSGDQHAATSDYAWFQTFVNGGQNIINESAEMRARAVRRLEIKGQS